MIVLGIETSCDETASSICKDGIILSSLVGLQSIHKKFGGVVPEIASREHDKILNKIVSQTLVDAKIPIAIKVSPDLNDKQIEVVSNILLDQDINIIIVSNTSDKNRDKLNNISKLEKGGLSGKPLYNISNDIISKFYKLLGNKIKIIGVGGVDSGEAAFEKIIRGASLVQLYTGMVYKGPGIASSISSELINILKNKGFKNISEAVGTKY